MNHIISNAMCKHRLTQINICTVSSIGVRLTKRHTVSRFLKDAFLQTHLINKVVPFGHRLIKHRHRAHRHILRKRVHHYRYCGLRVTTFVICDHIVKAGFTDKTVFQVDINNTIFNACLRIIHIRHMSNANVVAIRVNIITQQLSDWDP